MKYKLKLMMLAVSAGSIAFQIGNCSRFLGDLAGDFLILGAID